MQMRLSLNVRQTVQDILNFLHVNCEIKADFDDTAQNMFYDVKPKGKVSQIIINNENTFQIGRKIFPKSGRRFLRKTFMINKRKKNVGPLNIFQKLLYEIKNEKPKMDERDREILTNFYNDDVKNLEILLKRKLPWSNFQK